MDDREAGRLEERMHTLADALERSRREMREDIADLKTTINGRFGKFDERVTAIELNDAREQGAQEALERVRRAPMSAIATGKLDPDEPAPASQFQLSATAKWTAIATVATAGGAVLVALINGLLGGG